MNPFSIPAAAPPACVVLVHADVKQRLVDRIRTAGVRALDVAVLDLRPQRRQAPDAVRTLRATRFEGAVVVIDQRRSSQERIAALEAGADDVLDVQMGEEELVARIRAVLRRAQSRPQPTPNAQVLSLNWGCKTVEHHGLRRTLTQTEFNLMVVLTINAGRIVLRRHLLLIVWGGVASDSRAKKVLNTYIFSLRRKLASIGGAPHAVQTIRGVGFSLHGAASTTERSPAETPSSS